MRIHKHEYNTKEKKKKEK